MTNQEITAELLLDLGKAVRGVFIHAYGIPSAGLEINGRPEPFGAAVEISFPRPKRLEAEIDNIVQMVAESTRITITESLPSLADGLRVYVAKGERPTVRISARPRAPIYPHIITATVKELRITDAGKAAIARGELEL